MRTFSFKFIIIWHNYQDFTEPNLVVRILIFEVKKTPGFKVFNLKEGNQLLVVNVEVQISDFNVEFCFVLTNL